MSTTLDCRITVRELIIEGHVSTSSADARRVGEAIARAVAARLQMLQERRLTAFRSGRAPIGSVDIDALRVCLRGRAARRPRPAEIANAVIGAVARELDA